MMVPFDGTGAPQQGQSGVAPPQAMRQMLGPGMGQAGMPPGHHQPMNPQAYGHRNSATMGQPPYFPPPSPARQGSFSGTMPSGQYSGHPPLHSPHQSQGPPPMHPSHYPSQHMPHRGSMGGQHPGMPPMPHDSMQRPQSQAPPPNHSQQPPQQQRQQQYMGSSSAAAGMSGGWQSDSDTPHRREMIQQIVKLLKKDKSGGPDQLSRLPQMAKQLEVSLYRSAPSFDAYMDMSTLKRRLQMIAREVHLKTRNQNEPARDDHRYSDRTQSFPGQNGMHTDSARVNSPHMGNSSGSSRMVNMDDINPMASSGRPQSNSTGFSSSRQNMNAPQSQRSSSATQPPPSRSNDPEWKKQIRHKQQRLLLLHHSAKCQHEDGRCHVTPHCADMKRLWRHMEGCKDNTCRVPHCFSSRAILSHYRKCQDQNCPACGPVRETVRKSKMSRSSSSPSSGLMRSVPSASSSGQAIQQLDPLNPAPSFQSSGSRSSGYSGMPPPPRGPGQYPSSTNGITAPAPSSSSAQPSYSPSSQTGPSDPNLSTSRANDASSVTLPPRSSSASSAEWQKIRHKQQRLLLLRHASRCQHEDGQCPVTPHCAAMKRLWEHIAHCKNQQCQVQHCLTSRYVLSHYRRCADPNCPACGPVRETIRKQHEREKLRQQQNGGIPLPGEQLLTDSMLLTGSRPSPPEDYERASKRSKAEDDRTMALPTESSSVPMQPISKVESGKNDDKDSKCDYSLLGAFTMDQLHVHLKSLDRKTQLPPAKLKTKCSDVLKGLQTHQHGWVFNCPVDPVELGLPDYFEIIKKPMDLGTIQKKLENGVYHSVEEFAADVHLTFDNAMTYNEDGSVVYDMAKELKSKFAVDYKKLMAQLEAEDRLRRQNERACTLCGCEKLLFEPPVYFCNGMNCQNQRIRRNSHFFVGGNGQYFWCSTCYNELDDKIPIELVDMTVMKGDLTKKKNDEVHEESWVQCDTCERWVHQICGLFNTRQNKEHHSEYCCPRCLLDKKKRLPASSTPKPAGAIDLPRTMLSEWLEKHIAKRITTYKRNLAEEKALADNISLEEATRQVEAGGPVIIRQVTSMDRKLEVRELMKKRYAHKNYPDEFSFRCKCIVVFQELDGVDVILFALYVYEHGDDNPAPNKKVVYISYLDSVHFMRPRKMRTFVYHEILIAYLDYARRKGFATAHIWACPPLKGDDYIFYCKPEDQKTPRDARLRQWYIDMLVECQKRNIVGKVTNMYDLYFADESLDATAVPYLEGDYFPGEAENIIKMLEEGGGKKGGAGGKKKKKGSKNKGGNTGTRSTGVDEEALIASGCYDGVKSLKDLDRDQVMFKLGETIQPMKDSFIVAFLNWSGAREEDMMVPDEIVKARAEFASTNEDITGSKRDAVGNIRDSSVDKDGQPIKVIDDDEEDLDCEFLNNRQAFLNLCRGNHYQFDELRRAKHTSMMVLWHLHNRDAPKFVQQCIACNREILSGMRYHCNTCQEYDLCQECFKNPSTNRGACSHKLQPIAVDNESGQDRSGLTEAERLQRQRNLLLHIQLIEHASRCDSKQCSSSNCAKMKTYLHHAGVCRVKAGGGCRICKRIWTLLRIHAQKCRDRNCPIPQCNAIREKMRQLQKQQQAMDDRRRLEMNRHMRFGGASGNGQ